MSAALRHWLHRRRHPVRYAHLARLLHTQALDRDALTAYTQQALAEIVEHAVTHTRYYTETLGPLHDRVPFDALPILAKDAVLARLDDLLADDADRSRVKIGHTGGSTGKPLAFWYDDAKHELMRGGMMRSYMLSGWRPGQKIVNFWGARQDVVAGGVFGAHYGDFVAAEHTIAAYEYDEAKLVDWARFVQRYRPVLLQGYASVLADLADVVIAQRLAMPATLVGVYSTAEVLDRGQRARIEQAFGCRVHNQYGSREIPNIACECRAGAMHVFTDMVHLESTPADHRLLVTSLTNRLMPMIRYDIGDRGRLVGGACRCGLPFPLMEMDMCRQNDLIRTRGGRTVHPSYFNRLLYGETRIRQYQWVQEAVDRITLRVVAAAPLDDATLAALGRRIREDVDREMALAIDYVDAIERTVSGKHRYVIGLPGGR